MQRFKLKTKQGFYSYAILNCGGTTGNAEKILKRFYKFDAIFGILTPDNYVPMFKTLSDEVKETQLDKAEADIAVIAELINKKETGRFDPYRGRLPRLLTAIIYPIYKCGRKTKKFSVNDNCTACALCKEICPRRIIEIEKKPKWKAKQCEICLGCLHRCPSSAINYGKKTAKNGRYINPRTKL